MQTQTIFQPGESPCRSHQLTRLQPQDISLAVLDLPHDGARPLRHRVQPKLDLQRDGQVRRVRPRVLHALGKVVPRDVKLDEVLVLVQNLVGRGISLCVPTNKLTGLNPEIRLSVQGTCKGPSLAG